MKKMLLVSLLVFLSVHCSVCEASTLDFEALFDKPEYNTGDIGSFDVLVYNNSLDPFTPIWEMEILATHSNARFKTVTQPSAADIQNSDWLMGGATDISLFGNTLPTLEWYGAETPYPSGTSFVIPSREWITMATLRFEVADPLVYDEFIVEPAVFDQHFGEPASEHYFGGTAENVVPEPSCFIILTIALSAMGLTRRKVA